MAKVVPSELFATYCCHFMQLVEVGDWLVSNDNGSAHMQHSWQAEVAIITYTVVATAEMIARTCSIEPEQLQYVHSEIAPDLQRTSA